jgi:hypothetical protein
MICMEADLSRSTHSLEAMLGENQAGEDSHHPADYCSEYHLSELQLCSHVEVVLHPRKLVVGLFERHCLNCLALNPRLAETVPIPLRKCLQNINDLFFILQ